ncbi:hypothetical protein NQD34_018142 [Periophthalmus magnuspinnatus]|nr:hypothetical protein NQD34_018142 [Periophthalmus magnuspinnatus]
MKQKMADLSLKRVIPNKAPFPDAEEDYFGHSDVKKDRSLVKRYGVICMCLTTRGQIMAQILWKPNREPKESLAALNQNKIQRTLVQDSIKWHFNKATLCYLAIYEQKDFGKDGCLNTYPSGRKDRSE